MTKMTIGVYKSNKNAGRFRFHRKNTNKIWKHYFLDEDEGEYTFQTEWVSAFKAIILKRNQQYKKTFVCLECGGRFTAYVPKNTTEYKDECPHCGE